MFLAHRGIIVIFEFCGLYVKSGIKGTMMVE